MIRLNRIMISFSLFEHELFGKPVSTFPDHALTEAATFLDYLDFAAVRVGDEEEARQRRAVMLEIAQRPRRQFLPLEPGVLGIEIVNYDGEMAVSEAASTAAIAPQNCSPMTSIARRCLIDITVGANDLS